MIFILEPREEAKVAIGKRGGCGDYLDGWLSIRHNVLELACRAFAKIRHVDQSIIADAKRGAGVAFKMVAVPFEPDVPRSPEQGL